MTLAPDVLHSYTYFVGAANTILSTVEDERAWNNVFQK
jgi:hypothetical protein